MGLFENLQRQASKYGLWKKAVGGLPWISLLAAIAGVVWLLILPIEGQYRNTYISENALLPGQAHTYFRETEWHVVRGYREEVHRLEGEDEEHRAGVLHQWFEDIGLKTGFHKWEVTHGDEVKSGTNVYGILHAPRGDNTEAMVLVAPWFNKDEDYNDGGVALCAALARYLKKWSVWSKNIVFVVTSDSQLAIRQWVEAYHTSLDNTAGAIEAAIVLDYPRKEDYFDIIEVYYDGLNGQLPNLDLINAASIVAGHEGLRMVIQDVHEHNNQGTYWIRAKTLLRGIAHQLFAGINGPGPGGEHFSGWRIDTITLRAHGIHGPADITTFGRVAESVFRSVNNLLEHFHQSFFFYFLLGPKRFVSIGTYLPAAMLVTNSFTVMAIYAMAIGGGGSNRELIRPVALATAVFAVCTFFGWVMLWLRTELAVYVMLIATAITHVTPAVATRFIKTSATPNGVFVCNLQALSLILHGLFLTTLATVNFALALVVGLLTIPVAWVGYSRKTAWLWRLSSPFTAILLWAAYKWYHSNEAIDLFTAYSEAISGLLWGWRGLHVWTWGVVASIWLPTWIIAIIVGIINTTSPSVDAEKKTK